MVYPLDPNCDTQPLITVKNITLNNIETHGGLLPAGILRCHESNPCTGMVFNNVIQNSIWRTLGFGYITENM